MSTRGSEGIPDLTNGLSQSGVTSRLSRSGSAAIGDPGWSTNSGSSVLQLSPACIGSGQYRNRMLKKRLWSRTDHPWCGGIAGLPRKNSAGTRPPLYSGSEYPRTTLFRNTAWARAHPAHPSAHCKPNGVAPYPAAVFPSTTYRPSSANCITTHPPPARQASTPGTIASGGSSPIGASTRRQFPTTTLLRKSTSSDGPNLNA